MTRKGTRGLGRPGDLLPVGCALLALWTAAVPGQGAVINLTDTTIDSHSQSVTNLHEGTDPFVGGIIGETVFRRPTAIDPRNSGSGVYRDLYRIQDSPTTATEPENGYNRDGVMDSAVPNGFNPFIRYSNLVEDSSHQYFVFSLDINENKGANNEYLSLDAFRIYCGGSTDPNPLPTSVGALGDLGTLVYDMNADGQSFVLMDAGLAPGSGVQDLFVFVKKSLFTGAAAGDYIYLYSSFGQYEFLGGAAQGFNASDGPEQWSLPTAYLGQVEVPEPSTLLVVLLACAGVRLIAPRFVRPRGNHADRS